MIAAAVSLSFILLAPRPAPTNCRALAESSSSLLREGSAALDPARALTSIGGAYAQLTVAFEECKHDFQFVVLYFQSVKLYAERASSSQAYAAAAPAITRGQAAIDAIGASRLPKAEKARRIAKLKDLISKLYPYVPDDRE